MRSTTRRTTIAVATAALAALLAVPMSGAAFAQGHHNDPFKDVPKTHVNDGPHGWHGVSNPATKAARDALKAAVRTANDNFHTA